MKTTPLNIMLSYPVKWGKEQILRDIVQNFYDDAGALEFWIKLKKKYEPPPGACCLRAANELNDAQ